MNYLAQRQALIDAGIASNAQGINQGTSGNASVRVDQGFLITPSGIPYESLTPSDIVLMSDQGSCVNGEYAQQRRPSSEWRFHYDIFRYRPDVKAIMHTHSIHATALACLQRGIPAFHYMVAMAGGNTIRCAEYATFGTQALSDVALKALDNRKACLLAHHGVIATGDSLSSALALAAEVETLAHQYTLTLTLGEPEILSGEEMEIVVDKFKAYGEKGQA
jgi:L-fuculose-phosphate aldolase